MGHPSPVHCSASADCRALRSLSPFPGAFDTPIAPREIVTLATPFFASCPQGSAPSLQGFPAITVSGTAKPGNTLTISGTNTTGAANCVFLSGLNSTSSSFSGGSCQIPSDGKVGDGQVYVLLAKNATVSDATVVAGPAIIEVDTGSAAAAPSAGSSVRSLVLRSRICPPFPDFLSAFHRLARSAARRAGPDPAPAPAPARPRAPARSSPVACSPRPSPVSPPSSSKGPA